MGDGKVTRPHTNINLGGKLYQVDRIQVPDNRVFCEAWTKNSSGAVVTVNMHKAREIQRDRIRKRRADRWGAADAAWNMAQEANDAPAMLKAGAYRQALRDAPAHTSIDSAQTPDELSAVILDAILTVVL